MLLTCFIVWTSKHQTTPSQELTHFIHEKTSSHGWRGDRAKHSSPRSSLNACWASPQSLISLIIRDASSQCGFTSCSLFYSLNEITQRDDERFTSIVSSHALEPNTESSANFLSLIDASSSMAFILFLHCVINRIYRRFSFLDYPIKVKINFATHATLFFKAGLMFPSFKHESNV